MTGRFGSDIAMIKSKVLIAGSGEGELLQLHDPISFWGGVDPSNGRIIDKGHSEHGESVDGKIIALKTTIGSSSGSSVLLELLAVRHGPTGIILTDPDPILTLGVIVGRELGYGSIPVVQIDEDILASIPPFVAIDQNGEIRAITAVKE